MVSDGADTTDASLTDALLAMKAASVPVFTVGVGRESLAKDIQVDRVSAPRAALKGTSLMIDVVVTQTGFAGEAVTLDVEDGGRIVGSQEVKLPADGEPAAVRVRFTASEAGPRVFRFKVSPRPGEIVTQNNQREALIEVLDRREKMLYFEGEPRPEMKFIRRAVADDKNLLVVDAAAHRGQQVHAPRRRRRPRSWPAGFPRRATSCSRIAGSSSGSIEAGAFTGDQLRMIGEFVERRGGGLLMLGGVALVQRRRLRGHAGRRRAARGARARGEVARRLPVSRLKVRPTRAGEAHAVTQIAATEAASSARWNELPGAHERESAARR